MQFGLHQRITSFYRFFFCFCGLFLLPACKPIRSLGKNPSGEELKKIETLSNYREGAFQNLIDFPPDSNAIISRKPHWFRMLGYLMRKKPADAQPSQPLPVMVTNLLQNNIGKPSVIWFGHSSFLLKTATATLLFDPVFNSYAGPFKGMINAFPGTDVYTVKDLPAVDVLIISHDHYDHLDYTTIKQLKRKVKWVIVPIGVGSHFRKWGYSPEIITELNWDASVLINEQLTITATTAHHRSNRTFAQNKTLWASYVIEADGYKIYFSGDTGYSSHFKTIGDKYGPFDLALLECGQYNKKWPHSHMFPEQTARAALDLRASVMMPVHWAKFAESEHPWNEPVKRLLASCDSLKVPVAVPFIGQPYSIGQPVERVDWWNLQTGNK